MRLHPIGSRSSLSQRPDLRRRGASRSFGAEGAGAWSRLLAPLAACSVGDPTTGGETLRIDEASASEPLPPTLLTREAMAVPSSMEACLLMLLLRPPPPLADGVDEGAGETLRVDEGAAPLTAGALP